MIFAILPKNTLEYLYISKAFYLWQLQLLPISTAYYSHTFSPLPAIFARYIQLIVNKNKVRKNLNV